LGLLLIFEERILTYGKLCEEVAIASAVGRNVEKRVQGWSGHTEIAKQVRITYCFNCGGSRLVQRRYYEVKRLSKVSVKNILDFIPNSERYRANFITGAHNTL
jgi:hypothetical protein